MMWLHIYDSKHSSGKDKTMRQRKIFGCQGFEVERMDGWVNEWSGVQGSESFLHVEKMDTCHFTLAKAETV